MKKIYALFILVILLLSSCATQNASKQPLANHWIGKNAHSLVEEWGKPNEIISSTDESASDYIYTTLTPASNPPPATPTVATSVSSEGRPVITTIKQPMSMPAFTSTCKMIFTVNQQKTITHVKTEGNNCQYR